MSMHAQINPALLDPVPNPNSNAATAVGASKPLQYTVGATKTVTTSEGVTQRAVDATLFADVGALNKFNGGDILSVVYGKHKIRSNKDLESDKLTYPLLLRQSTPSKYEVPRPHLSKRGALKTLTVHARHNGIVSNRVKVPIHDNCLPANSVVHKVKVLSASLSQPNAVTLKFNPSADATPLSQQTATFADDGSEISGVLLLREGGCRNVTAFDSSKEADYFARDPFYLHYVDEDFDELANSVESNTHTVYFDPATCTFDPPVRNGGQPNVGANGSTLPTTRKAYEVCGVRLHHCFEFSENNGKIQHAPLLRVVLNHLDEIVVATEEWIQQQQLDVKQANALRQFFMASVDYSPHQGVNYIVMHFVPEVLYAWIDKTRTRFTDNLVQGAYITLQAVGGGSESDHLDKLVTNLNGIHKVTEMALGDDSRSKALLQKRFDSFKNDIYAACSGGGGGDYYVDVTLELVVEVAPEAV